MASDGENKELVLRYEEEEEATEESPTSYLRHLKEISYILEKLRSNRARFLLAAAHRRRHQLGSFAAKQRDGEEKFSLLHSSGDREDGGKENTNLQEQCLPGRHERYYPHQSHEKRESENQSHTPPERALLETEDHSDVGFTSPVSDATSRKPAAAHSEAEVSGNTRLPATATTLMPNVTPEITHFLNSIAVVTPSTNAIAAADAPSDKGQLPAATVVHRWENLDSSIRVPVIVSKTSSHVESSTSKADSVLQNTPLLTTEGDDLDLYLAELLVPLLHDGLVKLCRLIELKQNDKSKERLGAAFHEQFNPLRWLGQYLIRHHPQDGAAQSEEINRPDKVTLVNKNVYHTHNEKEPVFFVGCTQECSNFEFISVASGERTDFARGSSLSIPGAVEAISPSQTATHNETARTAHASCREAFSAEGGGSDPGFMQITETPEGTVEAAPAEHSAGTIMEQKNGVARVHLPAVTPESGVAIAPASDVDPDVQCSADKKAALAANQAPSSSHARESLHRRRMHQYASFYGILKDIVDDERIRRDFVLRREEVKHIFVSFCREKTESQLNLGRGSDSSLRRASTEWVKRLSQTLRRRSSIVTDRTFSFVGGNCSATGSPREGTTGGRPTSARAASINSGATEDVADAAVEAADNALEPLGVRDEHAILGTEGTVKALAREDADITLAQAPALTKTNSTKGVTYSGASAESPRYEKELKENPLLNTAGQLAVAQKPGEPASTCEPLGYLPVCVEDLQDILEKLDTHWGMEGRLLDIFRSRLSIPVAAEHADLLQYVLPQQDDVDLIIEDPEDVQPTEFWEFVKYYTEVHTGIRRELYKNRKRLMHVEAGTGHRQKLVELLIKKKMVILQEQDDTESGASEQGEKGNHQVAEG